MTEGYFRAFKVSHLQVRLLHMQLGLMTDDEEVVRSYPVELILDFGNFCGLIR